MARGASISPLTIALIIMRSFPLQASHILQSCPESGDPNNPIPMDLPRPFRICMDYRNIENQRWYTTNGFSYGFIVSEQEVGMKRQGKTNRSKAALKKKNLKRCLRKSRGERRSGS
jgi:hypothetical protein